MGRHVKIYDGPLSPEDYWHLSQRSKQFEISENERLYGKVGEKWSDEEKALWDELVKSGPQAKPEPQVRQEEEEEPEADWDPDDVAYVRELSYEAVQQELKKRLELEELPQGRDGDLRNWLLGVIDASHEYEGDDEENEDEDSQ